MKKFELQRIEYIETRLLWGEGLTAGGLGNAFEISRPIAQKSISKYQKKFPNQMQYDASQKCHIATSDFKPEFVRKDPSKFLDYLRGESLIGYYREEIDWSDFEIEDVNRLLRPKLNFEIMKTVFTALRRKQTISIEYKKKDLEINERTERIISPNHLVFVDNRYHIRAYCHLKHQFLDFVLSRIAFAEPSYKDWVPSNEDRGWQDRVNLIFKPNPELPEGVQKAILSNQDTVKTGLWMIQCRKALAFYVERSLTAVDTKYGKPLWVREGVSNRSYVKKE